MAEGGLVVAHLGDRTAVALLAAGRQQRRVAIVVAGARGQEASIAPWPSSRRKCPFQ
jgi:hypothetical protein